MSFNDDQSKELLEINHQLQDGKKGVNNEVGVQEQRPLEDDEVGNSSVAGDAKDGRGRAAEAQDVLQIPEQQQPQGAMVCWERFLRLRSLKVLLAENDDSTRHVVTALLRNCSYEVIQATNGLQAWKILEDLTNHVDLVLTEVVMPCLSGVGLLCKIMSHKTRKNVPVIMMSSHDSMGLVFKCLSKGAVDFLVKPIRKNELKNLWQHVWRRCHSSSGSGSESGAQTQKSVKSKSVEKSDNNTGSNDEEENGSVGLNAGDGSDNGSGTQSSWTKQAVEVDSPRQMSLWDQTAEWTDSTCAWVVPPNAETSNDTLVSAAARNMSPEQKENIDGGAMGKDLEIGMSIKMKVQLEYANDIPNKSTLTRQINLVQMGSSKFNEQTNEGQMDSTEFQASNGRFKSDIKNKDIDDADEMPSLELSFKRLRGEKSTGTTTQDDRNVLRRSDSSAFSRYNAASNANKVPTGNVGSTFPRDNSMEITKKEFHDIRSQMSGNPPNHTSNAASYNIDMGYTTNNAFTRHVVYNNSAAACTIQQLYPSSAFHPVKNDLSYAPQKIMIDNADDETASMMPAQSKGAHEDHHSQHLHIHYDNYQVHHHPIHGIQQQHPTDHNNLRLKQLATAAPHCGLSNILSRPVDANNGNCSINRSASGSNHGRSAVINVGGINIESENGVSGKNCGGDANGSGSGGADDKKSARREAALTKFRQKRKERCFRKRVRYQSRKKLAEQRPRVRGQFVRQTTASENTCREEDS